jgi:membrane protease YdiL (CAAX protease family)
VSYDPVPQLGPSDEPDDGADAPYAPPDEPPTAPLPVTAVQAIRFCRTCGSPWDPTWAECQHCVATRPMTVAAAMNAEVAYRRDQREIRSAVWLYFSLLGVSAIMIFALLVAQRNATAGEELFAGAAMAVITTVWCLVAGRDVLPHLVQPVKIWWFPVAIGAATVTYAIATAAVLAIDTYFKLHDLNYLESFTQGGWSFPWAVLGICVMPGIFEELAFRGVIFGALQRVLGSGEALLVSALMFAILHLSVPSMPHLFLMGLALGWLRLRTGSLLPGMLMHFTHNLLVLLAERNGSVLPW